jgi:hypothetical protein
MEKEAGAKCKKEQRVPRKARSVINQSSVSQSVAHEFAPRTKVTRVGGALSLC